MCATGIFAATSHAQSVDPLQAGEGYITRFAGSSLESSQPSINLDGTVGSIVDLRNPGQKPQGHHWINEPQRALIKARDAGQVFGIAIDNASPPNIYVTATSKFGLHHDGTQWLVGQWGPEAGPGTVYKLRAENGYQPEILTEITLEGRSNTGAALGNVAFDKISGHLFVSDLETGMIHRIDPTTGEAKGRFDHGVDGRSLFIDASTGDDGSLPVVEFNPDSAARVSDCETEFSKTPACWNFADFRRRVWGLGVHEDQTSGTNRLYYAVWSSAPLGSTEWEANPEEQPNTVWSVGLGPDGEFELTSVRLEKTILGLEGEIASQAGISDIAFSEDGEMLVAETGVIRNLGLAEIEAFATPGLARVFTLKADETGVWQDVAAYDTGNRKSDLDLTDGMKNAAGGVDYGYGYTDDGVIAAEKVDQLVWKSGDYLCSPEGPCISLETGEATDEDQVHGYQGSPRKGAEDSAQDPEVISASTGGENAEAGSLLFDADINVDEKGEIDFDSLSRNDSTHIGDIEIYKTGEPIEGSSAFLVPVGTHGKQVSAFHRKYKSGLHNRRYSTPLHSRKRSHSRRGSHAKNRSHARIGSHNKRKSHARIGSHNKHRSHARVGSHNKRKSHVRIGSHNKVRSHARIGSHNKRRSHARVGSHNKRKSHARIGSHNKRKSHTRIGSHNKRKSHARIGSHDKRKSHARIGSHNKRKSHARIGSHNKRKSHARIGSHNKRKSHARIGSHNKRKSHARIGSHNKNKSHARNGSHNKRKSHARKGSHNKRKSHARIGSHNKNKSHARNGSHNKRKSHARKGSHNKRKSHARIGSHNKNKSHARNGSHNKRKSHARKGSHNKRKSHARIGSHNKNKSHARNGSHNKRKSHARKGSHNKRKSHARQGSHNKKKSHRRTGSHNKQKSENRKGKHGKKKSNRKNEKKPVVTF